MGMAKKLSEDIADLLLNERVMITLEDEMTQEFVQKVLDNNHFLVMGNDYQERKAYSGTVAYIPYLYNAIVTAVLVLMVNIFAPHLIRFISGSEKAVIIENGTMYLRVVAPAFFVLGVINNTRTALQAIGSKVLPVLSSIIELIGKVLFVLLLVPKFQYQAVIFCEPVIWCFMAVELVISFWRNPYIRAEK